jgi:protein-S-isoprenylcysteine O-methyltransferase Ste14
VRRLVFRLRGAVWFAAFLVAWLAAKPTQAIAAGMLALVLAGQALRFWAAGHIGAYRGETVEAPRLTRDGPYAIVRNPLYIGNGLIGLGWSLPAGAIGLVFPIAYVLVYIVAIVPLEEAFLTERFGDEYRQYRRETPGWWRTRWPAARPGARAFDARAAWRAEVHSLWMNAVGTLLILLRPAS